MAWSSKAAAVGPAKCSVTIVVGVVVGVVMSAHPKTKPVYFIWLKLEILLALFDTPIIQSPWMSNQPFFLV